VFFAQFNAFVSFAAGPFWFSLCLALAGPIAVRSPGPAATDGLPASLAGSPGELLTGVATVALAFVTLVVAVVPAGIRQADIKRDRRDGRIQLDNILRYVEKRIATIVSSPQYPKKVLAAGLDVLFARSLETDFAHVLTRDEMTAVYDALNDAYDTIVEALERERQIVARERAEMSRPFARWRRSKDSDLRTASEESVQNQARHALKRLHDARELLKQPDSRKSLGLPF
jgi:hypothetical protein